MTGHSEIVTTDEQVSAEWTSWLPAGPRLPAI
jgi:hypothetical protein